MDNSQMSASYNAGQTKGQAEEKGSQIVDKASQMATSAKETVQEAGGQMMAKATEAADVVKDKTGINSNK